MVGANRAETSVSREIANSTSFRSLGKIMKKKHAKVLAFLGILLIACIVACIYAVYNFNHPRIGSCSGRVIDAATGKPIEGAVVNFIWEFSGFMGVVPERLAACSEAVTDKDGNYYICSRRVKRDAWYESVRHEFVIVYKDGYAVYTAYPAYRVVGRSFGYAGQDQDYRRKNNLVKLYPWNDAESHREHLSWIDTIVGAESARTMWRGNRLQRELAEERMRAAAEKMQ